jgi:hypothetical protein
MSAFHKDRGPVERQMAELHDRMERAWTSAEAERIAAKCNDPRLWAALEQEWAAAGEPKKIDRAA